MTRIAPTPETLRESLRSVWDTGAFDLVVLFGSWATGRGGPHSDLDLAFMPRNGMDETSLTSEVIRLTHWNDVDVVNLAHVDPLLAMQIAESGIVLFEADPSSFAEFRSLAFRRYVDTEKLRRAQRDVLDAFGRGHEPR
ncbi:MAG TPA: nucleotidyltransferase domain-containing protein [Candidatus Polarisedimenticolaceae bacterium]|nr:nucleotidyltransferase domain-containing protein [Candidatus Polarisedimenticolaceae bacterium]